MNTLYKICIVLIVFFVISLVLLVVEIFYVLWHRRRFWSGSVADGDVEFSDESFYQTPSKELLYFFCWKNQTSRIELAGAETTAAPVATAPPLPPIMPADAHVDEMLKQHALYGPSKVLFTIKEEEKEEMETDSSSAENGERKRKKKTKKKSRSTSLEDVAVTAVVIDIDDSTPFSTPCASPPYYTPSPSPSRDRNYPHSSAENIVLEAYNDMQIEPQETKDVSGDKTMSLVSIEFPSS
ncbi:hypothetical protein P3X46_009450 [Hevea brasiliensis]|uniref:Uncharacterized protein n=1 Tax=Hevea brasiliensis TaxID=3981 RepID=A0ABQ9MPJ2_HEVBR|nr:uncharacterized protein LOC110659069 [Hevea brasiliensis]KAJ9181310.1 hypothetical protein P3X46_009450 [Hevea brasiliensis]